MTSILEFTYYFLIVLKYVRNRHGQCLEQIVPEVLENLVQVSLQAFRLLLSTVHQFLGFAFPNLTDIPIFRLSPCIPYIIQSLFHKFSSIVKLIII